MLAAIVVAVAVVGLARPHFVSAPNLRLMLLNSVVLSVAALGQTLVIATRGVDLSVAPVLRLSAMATGLLAQGGGLPLAAAFGLALLIGLVLGAINDVLGRCCSPA